MPRTVVRCHICRAREVIFMTFLFFIWIMSELDSSVSFIWNKSLKAWTLLKAGKCNWLQFCLLAFRNLESCVLLEKACDVRLSGLECMCDFFKQSLVNKEVV
uniref:Uncharacterized protein n=1 Tax=Micrurus lemniscatus lemniscatus TaxID=129467 RepID=A0A2D4JGN8_MICLE